MRDDLIKATDPMFGRYREMRDNGASHESALQQIKCDLSQADQQKRFDQQAKLISRYSFA